MYCAARQGSNIRPEWNHCPKADLTSSENVSLPGCSSSSQKSGVNALAFPRRFNHAKIGCAQISMGKYIRACHCTSSTSHEMLKAVLRKLRHVHETQNAKPVIQTSPYIPLVIPTIHASIIRVLINVVGVHVSRICKQTCV